MDGIANHFRPKTIKLEDFAHILSQKKHFRGYYPGLLQREWAIPFRTHLQQSAPGAAWTQTPISALPASVPIVLVLRNDH